MVESSSMLVGIQSLGSVSALPLAGMAISKRQNESEEY